MTEAEYIAMLDALDGTDPAYIARDLSLLQRAIRSAVADLRNEALDREPYAGIRESWK